MSADRIVTVYRRDPETTARLEQLVDLEEDGCAGVLEFRLTYAARELVLLVRTAPGAGGSIDEILAEVTGSATGG